MSRLRLITRIALFAALLYATSWSLVLLPNVKVSFFIIFTAGFVWGALPGILVGIVGTGLWSLFNPYGPVALPIFAAQVVGSAACGLIGSIFQISRLHGRSTLLTHAAVALCGILCVTAYYTPVNLADAWLFQPFWPRLVASLPWTLVALCANALIFPLLFPVARLLYDREKLVL
jgi:uncharacterized membrane protein